MGPGQTLLSVTDCWATDLKQGLLKYEPWRVVLAAFLSGAATLGAIVGLLTVILK
jgi:RsiW-degrading membrane proteinase PrsW (M82 family)